MMEEENDLKRDRKMEVGSLRVGIRKEIVGIGRNDDF